MRIVKSPAHWPTEGIDPLSRAFNRFINDAEDLGFWPACSLRFYAMKNDPTHRPFYAMVFALAMIGLYGIGLQS